MAGSVNDLTAVRDWPWITVMTALLLLVPWLLFMSDIVFPSDGRKRPLVLLYIAYLISSGIFHLAFTSEKANAAFSCVAATTAGGLLFAVGIALIQLPFQGTVAFLAVAGAVACAAGSTLLVSQWYPHYARMAPGVVALLACLGMAGSALLYATFMVVSAPFRLWAVALVFACVPCLCARKVPAYGSDRGWYGTRIGDSEVFSQQKWPRIAVLFAIVCTAFGIFVAANLNACERGEGLLQDIYLQGALLAATFSVAVFLYALAKRRTSVIFLLDAMGALLVVGLLTYANPAFRELGFALVFLGFVAMNMFHLVFYASICRLRKYVSKGFTPMLGRVRAVIPAALLAGAMFQQCGSLMPSGALSGFCIIGGSAMLVNLLVVFTSEIGDTRKELSGRSTASISLDDIRRFAQGSGLAYRLTPRECELIHLFMGGRSVDHVARELCISKSTVKTHVASIYRKLNVSSRQAMIDAVSEGIERPLA